MLLFKLLMRNIVINITSQIIVFKNNVFKTFLTSNFWILYINLSFKHEFLKFYNFRTMYSNIKRAYNCNLRCKKEVAKRFFYKKQKKKTVVKCFQLVYV